MDYQKLETKYQAEYDALAEKLQQQATLNDPQKMGQLSQQFAEVKEILETVKTYNQTQKELSELEKTVQSEDSPEMQSMIQDEIQQLEQKTTELEAQITELTRPQDPRDKKNAIMEIRAGTGGDESTLFAADLFRMYTRYAENKGWQTEILSSNRNEINGYKEIIFEVKGQSAYGRLKYESGVHRVQRVPATEKSGRIHTSAVSVVVLPEAEEVDLKIDPSDLRVDTFCASGHGGQSVNTTYSAVRITHLPSGIVATCQDEKSQQQNKIKAMQVLRSRLLQKIEEEKQAKQDAQRKSHIGTGDRSEKIRTYNWPQDRLTDHRIKLTLHNLDNILDGKLDQIIDELIKAEHAADQDAT